MLESRLANMLLFVPYNREYNVSTEVKNKLTDQEFFLPMLLYARF